MKRAIFLLLAAVAVGLLSGCAHKCGGCGPLRGTCASSPENCDDCSPQLCHECRLPLPRCCCHNASRRDGGEQASDGYGAPPSAAVTYPYYTTRGPRDYLARSPRPLGP